MQNKLSYTIILFSSHKPCIMVHVGCCLKFLTFTMKIKQNMFTIFILTNDPALINSIFSRNTVILTCSSMYSHQLCNWEHEFLFDSLKGTVLQRGQPFMERICSFRSKFFPLRADPFGNRKQNKRENDKTVSSESILIHFNIVYLLFIRGILALTEFLHSGYFGTDCVSTLWLSIIPPLV